MRRRAPSLQPGVARLGDAHHALVARGVRLDQPVPLQVVQRLGSVPQPLDRAQHADQVTLGQLPPARELLEHRALYRRVVHLARHRAQYTDAPLVQL